MDPKILAMMQQIAQQQGGQPGQPQPGVQPQGEDPGFDFGPDTKQNPYASMMQQAQPAQQVPQQGMPLEGEEMEDQMNPGENPDSTKFLMGAINSLENYIKKSADRDEIATARSIIMLLGRLIQRDQENMAKQLG